MIVLGILFMIVSIGFYYHNVVTAIRARPAIQLFKLVFSISAGWLLVLIVAGGDGLEYVPDKWTVVIHFLKTWVFPIICFIGLEMIIYGFFRDE